MGAALLSVANCPVDQDLQLRQTQFATNEELSAEDPAKTSVVMLVAEYLTGITLLGAVLTEIVTFFFVASGKTIKNRLRAIVLPRPIPDQVKEAGPVIEM